MVCTKMALKLKFKGQRGTGALTFCLATCHQIIFMPNSYVAEVTNSIFGL